MATLGQGSSLIFRIDGDSSGFRREMKAVDASLGNIGSKFSAFANAAALPAAAIASVAAIQARVAAQVVTGLFNLAKSASDAGSEIKDMQDKTGLAAVTLSTLKLAADSAGSSFEQVGGGIAKFAKLLGEAKNGNETAQASLAALGVGTTDLDEALKQVIKSIADAKEGTDQITLAQKAFGKAGADLIPVIKQINGNLAEAEKEAKKLGTTLTESDIKAADEFGDTLGVLSTQVSTLANRFALQFAPQITAALVEVINFLARNQSVAVEWGSVIADVLRGVMGVFSYAKTIVGGFLEAIGISFTASAGQARAWAQAILLAINPVLAILARIGQIIGANTPKEAQEGGGFAGVGGGDTTLAPGGGKGGGGGGGASAKDTAEQQRQKAIQEQQAANGRALTAYKAFLDIQESELKQSLNLRLIDEVKYAKAIAEIKLKELLFEQTQNAKLLKDERLSDEERTDAENKKVILIRKVAKARIDIGNEVYQAIKKQTEQELKDLEKKLEDEEKIRQKARDKANAAADVDLQNKLKKRDARKERDPFNTGGPQEGANGDLDWQVPLGGDFITGVVDGLGAANEQLPIMQQLGQQLAATFGQVAQAVGAAVKSFVLFGTAGQSFRKFAAEVIASIAQMSIVQAVFELAQGFAMLALAWFTGNPKYKKSAVDHFTAAAVFGAIGGVAAGVGRGVAGDSFKNETGGGSGGGSGGEAAGQPEKLNFTERFNGFQQGLTDQMARVMQRTNEVLGGVTEAVDTFNQKFGITTPGAVVMAGAGDAGEAIFGAVTGHLDSDLRAGSDFIRSQGKMNSGG